MTYKVWKGATMGLAESLTKGQMIELMITWAEANPAEHRYHWEKNPPLEQRALAELCREAMYKSGRDDWGGCVLCRS